MIWRLRRLDIAPPGGFRVKAPTGAFFQGVTFSGVVERLASHLEANGYLPGDAEDMVETQTAQHLKDNGFKQWVVTEK